MENSMKIPQKIKNRTTMCCVVLSCLSRVWLCDPMDHSPPGSSVHGDSPSKNPGVGCQALLQGFFLIQGLNPGLPHCRWILYSLSHEGSPRKLEWITSLCLLQGIFPIQESNQGLPHCRRILYQLSSIPEQPELSYDLAIPFLAIFLTKIRYMHPNVHFSIIYSSQYMEAI